MTDLEKARAAYLITKLRHDKFREEGNILREDSGSTYWRLWLEMDWARKVLDKELASHHD